MWQWQKDLEESQRQFREEMDESQDECYNEFLEMLGLDHTEQLWNAFAHAWSTGYGWGLDQEYSYPS